MGWFKWKREANMDGPQVSVREIMMSSLNDLLSGKLFLEYIHRHKLRMIVLLACCLFYIYMGFTVERLYAQKAKLEKEVIDLRFISNTQAADLMFSKKKSEIDKKISESGLSLQNSKEPPFRIYEK